MIILYVENKLIDIDQGISTLITFAIDDLKDFGAKNSAFSKTMVLPGSARNNTTLGNIFQINQSNPYDDTARNITTNFNATKRASAIIFQDNIQVFKGTFRILKIIDDGGRVEYEAAVFGELGGFVAALGALKLEQLDFSEHDHLFNTTNILASWNTVNGKGYYYPFIDYANMSTTKLNWDIRTFRPGLYVREFIVKIFADAGYRFTSAILNSPRFRSLIITSTRKESGNTYVTESFLADFRPRLYYPPGGQMNFLTPSKNLFFNTAFETITWTQGTGYTTTHNISVIVRVDDPPATDFNITLNLRKNGVIIKSTIVTIPPLPGYTLDFPLVHAGEATTTNDVFDVTFRISSTGDPVTDPINVTGGSWEVINTPAFLYTATVGSPTNLNTSLPKNILQKDLISSIAKLFNLLIYEAADQSKLLVIEPWVDFYDLGGGPSFLESEDPFLLNIDSLGNNLLLDNGEVNAVDWSYKLDRNRPIEIVPMSELNARYYDYKYKQDSDYWNEDYNKKWNETYGNRRFDSEFDFSKDIEEVDVLFASTPLIKYSDKGDDKIMPAIYKLSGPFNGVDTKETPFEGSIRILQAKKITCVAYNILDGATVLASPVVYGYAGHFDNPTTPTADLNFGATKELNYAGSSTTNNQFNLYWSAYMAEITDKDSRLITAHFHLTDLDIAQLDFSKFVYIDGNMFRLNKIEDWNATAPDTCKVSLLKVLQTVR